MVQGQRAPSCFGSCPHVPNTPKFHLPFASGRFFVTIASGTLYTETCYAVTPCADTAHIPQKGKGVGRHETHHRLGAADVPLLGSPGFVPDAGKTTASVRLAAGGG